MAKRYRVDIAATAERDIVAIRDHITVDNAVAAGKWVAAVTRQLASLESFPLRGAVIPEARFLGAEYRQLLYGSYRTIYRVEDDRGLVVRVLHGARNLEQLNIGDPPSG
ncbi:MAG: type II toxin-antitoxin system RelE/ParE family toxin [Deltaproteobacteria bacterium]|nr:type II toxin-antitoxin system RelE/ParE family toxin [Deltaproteobacteria bacterium]